MTERPAQAAYNLALARLRDIHRDEFDALYREERAKLGLPPDRRDGPVAECGTRSGYSRHRRNGEDACRACKDANAARSRGHKAVKEGAAA